MLNKSMNGAEALIKALIENDVDTVFGYPGGAVLPVYDAIFKNNRIKHILVRHEQAAVHAAEGFARSTGKVGCVLVTSGPGATNAITGLTDALMDSVPLVCITGQVPTHLIGTDAFQEADTTGISRPATKHNYLVKKPKDLCKVVHEAFEIASTGRPGPVLIDLPKDIQLSEVKYEKKTVVASKKNISNKLINGPISKKTFLNNKFNGITEYLAKKTNTKDFAMIIYNKKLSVCPMTTHLPIKYVSKSINKLELIKKVRLINKFWKTKFNKKVKIGITGLNPHCESIDKFNEDEKIIKPLIKNLQKKYSISGPFPADTTFLKKNRKKYNVIVGMYHDQVLTPIKTIYEYDAINITLGLPFLRVSPDHGPNEKMLGKNKSNPFSLIQAISFLDKV